MLHRHTASVCLPPNWLFLPFARRLGEMTRNLQHLHYTAWMREATFDDENEMAKQ
jgi:hypothetical protein